MPSGSGKRDRRCCDDRGEHDEGNTGAARPRGDTRVLGWEWHRDADPVSQPSGPGRARRHHDSDNHEEGREREHPGTLRLTVRDVAITVVTQCQAG